MAEFPLKMYTVSCFTIKFDAQISVKEVNVNIILPNFVTEKRQKTENRVTLTPIKTVLMSGPVR